ncbi:MAG: cytochrome P450 [bacterium]|nr:cytochrome [Deltaproteobacteria bacterium]MCP4907971.1 cytochrome P450 [bacterium]
MATEEETSSPPDPESLRDPVEILDVILDPRRRGSLYPYFARMREIDPVHSTEVLHGRPGWVITRYPEARSLLSDTEMISDRRNADVFDTGPSGQLFFELMKRTLLYLDPPEHRRIRRFLSKHFTLRAIMQRRSSIEAIVGDLLDRAEEVGKMDLVKDFAYPVPTSVILEMLGVPREDLPIFHRWLNDFARRGDISGVTPEVERKGEESVEGFTDYFMGLIRERRKQPREDLMTILVQPDEGRGELSDDELVAACVLLIQGGHETTADMIGLSVNSLLHNPDQLQLLQREPERIQTGVDELIRYDSSVHVVQRVGAKDIELRGKTIPAGEVSLVLIGATNRDPAGFENPDTLDLTREKVQHLSFGLANNICLGAQLARAELRIAVGSIVSRFPGLRLADDEEPVYRDSLFLRGLRHLNVTW